MRAIKKYTLYIGGEWCDPHTGAWFDAENPYNGEQWCAIARAGAEDVDAAVAAAHRAFTQGAWPQMHAVERARLLRRAGDILRSRCQQIAELEIRDIGKRITESEAQIHATADWLDYYAGLADKIEGRVIPLPRADVFNYTLREPLGVVAAITPWNSPVMIAVWKIAPALAAGNTVIVKPSEHASASTLALMQVFEAAGFPAGVVNTITGFANECGQALVAHPGVAKVTFTGSETGGRAINQSAGASFKRVTMELGGKSPQIVFPDADISSAVNGVISGVFLSNGQTCVAGSRLYLHRDIADTFVQQLTAALADLRMGDPFDPATQIGPIANRQQFDKVMGFIEEACTAGAHCLYGGHACPDVGQGLFIQPTVFTNVSADMRIMREEVFGPVLVVSQFDDEEDVIAKANDSPYGLAAGVWTQNLQRAHSIVKRINSGTVYVNTYRAVGVSSPVGGYKNSGFGRENGIEAIDEFLQTKSVWVGIGEGVAHPLK